MLSTDELKKDIQLSKSFSPTAPPVGVVRSIAEFEHNESVIVAYRGWGFGIPIALIAEMSEDVIVTTIVEDASEESDVISEYTSGGVNLSNCNFIHAPSDSYWTRDYSPWFISVDNEVAIVDFPYDRPSRPNDDEMPIEFANYLNVDLYGMDLMHTGGNWMSDGMGVAASTELVEEENTSLSIPDINDLVEDFMGITNYYITTDPLGGYIKHIDCWGKFLDVDKILITEVPSTDSRYADFEAMADYWEGQISSYGNNYQVYRVYSPNGQPYTNSLILNNKVLVPIVTGTGSTWNDDAITVYETAMPGYEVIGFTPNIYVPWEETDALHCRTHELPDRGMLYINHLPTLGSVPYQLEYIIDADIIPFTGQTITQSILYYQVDGGNFTSVTMTNIFGNTYRGIIPELPEYSEVGYYIHAEDASSRTANHPYIGSPDPHIFNIGSTGIADINKFSTDIYPNPVSEELFVNIVSDKQQNISIKIIDITGKLVLSNNINVKEGNFVKNIDISNLHKGIYLIQINFDIDGLINKKIIVQ